MSIKHLMDTAKSLIAMYESNPTCILYDETMKHKKKDGTPFIKVIIDAGMIPGIKVDIGAKEMAMHPVDEVSEAKPRLV